MAVGYSGFSDSLRVRSVGAQLVGARAVGVVHGTAVAEDGLVTTFDRIGTTFAISRGGEYTTIPKNAPGC